jgi:hypothetical protein
MVEHHSPETENRIVWKKFAELPVAQSQYLDLDTKFFKWLGWFVLGEQVCREQQRKNECEVLLHKNWLFKIMV